LLPEVTGISILTGTLNFSIALGTQNLTEPLFVPVGLVTDELSCKVGKVVEPVILSQSGNVTIPNHAIEILTASVTFIQPSTTTNLEAKSVLLITTVAPE
jgi:hypothetical protein